MKQKFTYPSHEYTRNNVTMVVRAYLKTINFTIFTDLVETNYN